MNLNELLAQVSRCGAYLAVEAGELHYRGPSRGLTPALRHAISQKKCELLSILSKGDPAIWPPNDTAELVFKWNHLGRPQIPMSPGVSISSLESWFCSHWPDELVPDQVAAVRRFLWESLLEAEVPEENLLLDAWRATAIPDWQNRLAQAKKSGDWNTASKARWMLREILLDPEFREDQI